MHKHTPTNLDILGNHGAPQLNPIPKFGLIGHRGVAGLRPENTLASFQYAAELGLNWIELDVHLTKDHQWIVIHDATLDRTTNGHGNVQDYTLNELQQLEAGLWFNPPYAKQTLPSLKETLYLCHKLGLQVNIEIKGSENNSQQNAKLMHKFLQVYQSQPLQPIVSSFDLDCIIALRELDPGCPIGFLTDKFNDITIDTCLKHNFTTINCNAKFFTIDHLSSTAEKNIPVLLYTVNDPVVANRWLKAGVAAIFTDRPDLLLNA